MGSHTHAINHLPHRGITNKPHRLPSAPLDIKRAQAKHNSLQQASADRILGFTTIPFTYDGEANAAAIRLNNHGVEYLELDLPKAFRCLRDATKLDPNFALAHNNLGLAYLEIGELKPTFRRFDKAIILDETLDIAYGNAGLAHIEAGRHEAA